MSILIRKMGDMKESCSMPHSTRTWINLSASLSVRISDLEKGLECRSSAMASASAAPRKWMKAYRHNRVAKRARLARRLSFTWKTCALLGSASFLLSTATPTATTFSLTLFSGALFLCAAMTATWASSVEK